MFKRIKKRFFNKKRMIKASKGSISIFLCLLITPFLTVGLSLLEYSRYQEVLELSDELYELTGTSVFSSYDTYIHNRFGLMCTSQESDIYEDFDELLKYNTKSLGKQVDVSNIDINGALPLSDQKILRKQVLDQGQFTTIAAILNEDFNIDKLLEKLNGLEQFGKIADTVSKTADLTDKITTCVEKLEALQNKVTSINSAVSDLKTTASNCAQKLGDLYNKLKENGITLPDSFTAADIEAAVNKFDQTYINDLKNVYKDAKTLIDKVNTLKNEIGGLPGAISDFKNSVTDAKNSISSFSDSDDSKNVADPTGEITANTTDAMQQALDKMSDLIDEKLNNIKDSTVNTIKSAAQSIVDSTLDQFGITGIASRYNQIIKGDYFKLPLEGTAKEDIAELIEVVSETVKNRNADSVTGFLKDKFIPNINFNFNDLLNEIKNTVTEATNSITTDAGENVANGLSDLMNMVKEFFGLDLDFFYEKELNAIVDAPTKNESGYQRFFRAFGGMYSAVNSFKTSLQEEGVFAKIKTALTAIKDLLVSLGEMFAAIANIIGDIIRNIGDLCSDAFSGEGMKRFYERVLIAGYMTHNLPNRTDSKPTEYGNEGSYITSVVPLEGKAANGFDYSDIVRPASYVGKSPEGKTSFDSLYEKMNALSSGKGSDKMFIGAELEYIFAGTNSEVANQLAAFFAIYFMRLLLDIPAVFMDNEVKVLAASLSVGAWVVYLVYLLVEPLLDVFLLVKGNEVKFMRTSCWLTLSNIGEYITTLGSSVLGETLQGYVNGAVNGAGGGGSESPSADSASTLDDLVNVDYETHMLILLFLQTDPEEMIDRFSNIVKMESSVYYENQGIDFDINKTFTAINITADAKFQPFFDLGLASGESSLIPESRITQCIGY